MKEYIFLFCLIDVSLHAGKFTEGFDVDDEPELRQAGSCDVVVTSRGGLPHDVSIPAHNELFARAIMGPNAQKTSPLSAGISWGDVDVFPGRTGELKVRDKQGEGNGKRVGILVSQTSYQAIACDHVYLDAQTIITLLHGHIGIITIIDFLQASIKCDEGLSYSEISDTIKSFFQTYLVEAHESFEFNSAFRVSLLKDQKDFIQRIIKAGSAQFSYLFIKENYPLLLAIEIIALFGIWLSESKILRKKVHESDLEYILREFDLIFKEMLQADILLALPQWSSERFENSDGQIKKERKGCCKIL